MAGGDGTAGRTRKRVAPGVLANQMVLSGALLVLAVSAAFADPGAFASPLFYSAMAAVFVITMLGALLPWDRFHPTWAVAVPLVDIVAIILLRESAPSLGLDLLLIFPVIWVARTFPAAAAAGTTAFAISSLWLGQLLRRETITQGDFASFVILPVTLAFAAYATYTGARRSRAKTVLLNQHAATIESALLRARQQEQILDQVINAVDFGVVAFDRDRRVLLMNREQRRILTAFGAGPDEIILPVVYQADGVTRFTNEDRPWARAQAGQSFSNVVMWAGEPGGRRAAYAVASRVLHDGSGSYDGGVVVIQDVTKEVEAIRARDDLIGSVSHELRSPLTSVLGYIDIAREAEELQDQTRRMLDVAYANSERLLVLVTDLLRAASDADTQLSLTFVPCDLAEITRDSVESHRLFAEEREVELELDGDRSAPAVADPVRVRQVLDNLITNAIKYNLEWGIVTIGVHAQEDCVAIEVRDTGQGMAEEDLPRIFDRFYRTSSAKVSGTTGTGLGLAITRDIVERHGGELTVESALGIGTTFRFTIPVRQVAPVASEGADAR